MSNIALIQQKVTFTPSALAADIADILRKGLRSWASDIAAFVQQIHYWTTKNCGVVDDKGRRWIYNKYEKWLEQFPYFTEYAFRKIKSLAVGIGLIEVKSLGGCDRTLYYAVNYNHSLLAGSTAETLTTPPSVELSTDGGVDMSTDGTVDSSTDDIDTEITPENTSNTRQVDEILEKYEEKLKTYGIYRLSWSGIELIKNPRLEPITQALGKIPSARAERVIEAFLKWMRDAKNVENPYKAFAAALWKGWN